MRSIIGTLLLALVLLTWQQPVVAAVAPADISRAVSMVFAGAPGAVSGDVNADSRADAADVVGVLLGLRNPTQPGPYGVGVKRITFTKPSVTMPDQQRVLLTEIWYPGPPDNGPTDQHPGGKVDAPLADGARNLPLVIFSHGSCGYQEQSVFFTSYLASHGFIVAAPPHPGNTTHEILTCGRPESTADSRANRPADIVFVIDSLLALNDDPTSFFHGVIDPSRIGMSGHSFGGMTTFLVSAMDDRIVAGLAMAPVARGIEDEVASIRIPTMVEVGTLDGLLGNGELAYGLLQAPRYLLEIDNMTHAAFADLCIDCTPASLTLAEAHPLILRYAIPFLMRWVAGDHRFDAFLAAAAAAPGGTFSADATGT